MYTLRNCKIHIKAVSRALPCTFRPTPRGCGHGYGITGVLLHPNTQNAIEFLRIRVSTYTISVNPMGYRMAFRLHGAFIRTYYSQGSRNGQYDACHNRQGC
jgi:hypothetical protein